MHAPVPLQAPLHPANMLPAAAVAVSETLVPGVKDAVQPVLGVAHVTPAGVDATEPPPVPANETLKAFPAGTTVSVIVPDFPSLVAVIVTVPAATPVTMPFVETVATPELLDDHVTRAPGNALPLASRTAAVTCIVLPTVTDALATLSDTLETGGGGGVTGSDDPPEHPARRRAETTATSVCPFVGRYRIGRAFRGFSYVSCRAALAPTCDFSSEACNDQDHRARDSSTTAITDGVGSAAELSPERAQIRVDRRRMPHEKTRNEPEDRVVDRSTFSDCDGARRRPIGGGDDTIFPATAEGEVCVGDACDQSFGWIEYIGDVGDVAVARVLAPRWSGGGRGENVDFLYISAPSGERGRLGQCRPNGVGRGSDPRRHRGDVITGQQRSNDGDEDDESRDHADGDECPLHTRVEG